MRLRQVLVDRPLALDQIRHGVEPHPVDPEIKPEPHDVNYGTENAWIVEIQIRLVRIEAVPVIALGHRVPCPIGFFGIDKYNTGFREFLVGVAPYIKVAQSRTGLCPAGALKPRMLV